MTGQSCALLLVNNKKLENFKCTSCVSLSDLRIGANSGPTSDGAKPYFIVSELAGSVMHSILITLIMNNTVSFLKNGVVFYA